MKNRRGFTLIELIAVIVILGLVLLIAVPFFSGSLRTFREDYYTNINGNMRAAGQDFFSDNRTYLPHNYLKSQVIDLNTLEEQKYIDDVKDYNGDKCDSKDSYIISVKLSKEEYAYASCLKCPSDEYDGSSQSEYCDPAWRDDSGLGYTDISFTAADDVHVYIGTSRSDLKKLVVAYPKVKRCKGKPGDPCTKESGNLLKEVTGAGEDGIQPIYPINIDTVDTNKVGVYIVEYKYNEDTPSVYGKVYVYENKAPTIAIKKTNKVLTEGVDTVTSATHTINPTYDDTNPNDWAQELNFTFTYKFGSDAAPGLKVTSYQYRINNRWEDYCTDIKADGSCTKSEKREMNEDVPFRMIDSEGHISVITRSYTLKIDNTKPKCEVYETGTMGDNDWYVSDVTVRFRSKSDQQQKSLLFTGARSPVSGESYSGITTSTILRNTVNYQKTDTNKVRWYGYIEDKANNYGTCYVEFKRDATAPVCTLKVPAPDGDLDGTSKWQKRAIVKVEFDKVTDNDKGQSDYSKVRDYGFNTWNSNTKVINHTEDTAGVTYTGQIRDQAGNMSTCSIWFKKDSTVPQCELQVPAPTGLQDGDSKWHVINPVPVTIEEQTDNLSGVRRTGRNNWETGAQSYNQTEDTDNSGVTHTFQIRDKAGNMNTCSIWFKKDSTPPKCELQVPNPTGWSSTYSGQTITWHTTASVKVSFKTNTDKTVYDKYSGVLYSGIDSWTTGAQEVYQTADNAYATHTAYMKDRAGNTSQCSITFGKDSTPPTCTAKIPAPDGLEDNGKKWHKMSSVKVEIDTTYDNLSGVNNYGINTYTGVKTVTHTEDTAGITYTYQIKDNAGNTNTCSVWFKKDSTVPQCSLSVPDPTGDNNGGAKWHKTASVKVSWASKTDNLSGVLDYNIKNTANNKVQDTQAEDTAGITYRGTLRDKAGNSNTCDIWFKKDSTVPTCTAKIPAADGLLDGDTKWHKMSTVKVEINTTSDNLSGVQGYGINTWNSKTKEVNHTADTSSQTYTYQIRDNAGNMNTCSVWFKKDSTVPQCTLSVPDPTGDNNGGAKWHKTASVKVSWNSKTDNLSGVLDYSIKNTANNKVPDTQTEDTSGITYRGTLRDKAGNSNTCDIWFKKDSTAPTCTAKVPAVDGTNGWHKMGTVKVEINTTNDNLSGVQGYGINSWNSGTKEVNHTADTSSQTYTYQIRDNAGNMSTCSISFKKDSTAPTCSISTSGTVGNNGWYKIGTVSASFTSVSDNLSGESSRSITYNGSVQSSTTTSTTNAYFVGHVTDNAGNTNTCDTAKFNFDNSAPSCTSSGGSTWTNQNVTLTGSCSDSGGSGCSNITKTYSSNINSSTESPGTVTDGAGNSTACPGNQTVQIDKTAPTCSVSKSNTWTTSGVTTSITCDSNSGGSTTNCPSGDTGLTSSKTYTVTDVAGNSGSCGVEIGAQGQTRYMSCSSGNRCEAAGCETYKSCEDDDCGVNAYNSCAHSNCGTYSCNCSTCTKCTKTGYCDKVIYAAGTFSGSSACYAAQGVVSNDGRCMGTYECCKEETSYSCNCSTCNKTCTTAACGVASYNSCRTANCGCETYNASIGTCGCASWGSYGEWYNSYSCSSGETTDHSTYYDCRTLYF